MSDLDTTRNNTDDAIPVVCPTSRRLVLQRSLATTIAASVLGASNGSARAKKPALTATKQSATPPVPAKTAVRGET